VALVVGVSAYETVPRLPNAVNDSGSMADLFRKAGFDVVTARTDVNNLEFKRSIREFEDAVADADIAVVFYAGHGIEIRDVNYLLPTDAKLLNERDAEDEAITLDRLINAIEPAKRLRLIILDACRDNPFASKMKRRVATRAVTAGLGKVEPAMSDTLIAYAAKDKSVAADGDGENSPYTTALLKHLTEPGLDIRLAFGRVRDEVMRATGRKQEPYVYGSLGGGTMALVPAPVQASAPAVASVRSDQGPKTDYEIVERVGKREAWEVFLNTHKTGLYADLARVQLAKLTETAALGRNAAPGAAAAESAIKVTPNVEAPAVSPLPKPSVDEQRAWDRLKSSSDRMAIQKFLERYPTSPLAPPAQELLDKLDRLAREREEAARVEREAALQREEEDKRKKAAEAERKRLEREAALHRQAEERAKAAELARQKAEAQAAAKQREAEDRARIAEALAKQRAADEQIRAAAAERQRLEAQAAKERAEEQVKAAEAERQRLKAEAEARREKAEETARTAPEQQPASGDAAKAVVDAEAESRRLEREAVAAKAAEAKRQAATEERRKQAEAARAAAEARAEREAAAERREAAEEAAASRRKAAEAARAAAERRAEREEAAERRAAAEEARAAPTAPPPRAAARPPRPPAAPPSARPNAPRRPPRAAVARRAPPRRPPRPASRARARAAAARAEAVAARPAPRASGGARRPRWSASASDAC
jgi:hypothetical protein